MKLGQADYDRRDCRSDAKVAVGKRVADIAFGVDRNIKRLWYRIGLFGEIIVGLGWRQQADLEGAALQAVIIKAGLNGRAE